ncbi:MAG TPA: DUF4139 domain-containing protein [Phycisphaerae bacterium]|nr:DUF4139 domain-containing protein [Phycisphaerae bacterium]
MRHFPRMRWLAVAAVLSAGVAAWAAEAPPKEGVSLTVYNGVEPQHVAAEPFLERPDEDLGQNFAVVKEVRTLKLPEKVSTIQFRDVAKHIDPTSVHFRSLTDPEGTTVLEQNYEFDLVGADKLLDKYIDAEISVTTQQGKRYEGTLLSFDAQQLIIQGARGGLYMIQRPNNVQNVEFGKLPAGLLTRPTLVWQVATAKPGDHLAQVTYQTTGLSWRADYSVVVNAADTQMDLSGWVTLTNQCGVGFKDARLKLMAGDVRRVQPPPAPPAAAFGAAREKGGRGGGGFVEKTFFEYHLYTLGRPTTVNDNQVKQVELLTAAAVPVTKRYVFEPGGRYWHRRYGQGNTYKVNVYIEFKNSKESKLGMPLPMGKIRTYKRDAADGDLEFVGEDQIDHTPKDEELKLYVGDAFDVVGEKTVTDRKQDQRWREESIRLDLRNHKEEAVTVRVREHLAGGQWEIKAKSQDFKKIDASTIEFDVPVAKDGKAEVTYTVHYSW